MRPATSALSSRRNEIRISSSGIAVLQLEMVTGYVLRAILSTRSRGEIPVFAGLATGRVSDDAGKGSAVLS